MIADPNPSLPDARPDDGDSNPRTGTVRAGHAWLPYAIFAVTISLTLIGAYSAQVAHRTRERVRLDHAVAQSKAGLEGVIKRYMTLLETGRGIGMAQVNLSPGQFHKFVEALDLRKNYPGVQGLGVAIRMKAEQKAEWIKTARAKGMKDFHIWPDSDQQDLCVVALLEPPDERNAAMVGYDLFAERDSRMTLQRAIETGQTAASPRLPAQEKIAGRPQSIFLLCCPLYVSTNLPPTVEERNTRWGGFMYCPFLVDDFFAAAFRVEASPLLDFQVYDSTDLIPANLLHDTRVGRAGGPTEGRMTVFTTLEVAGRTWSLAASPKPEFLAGAEMNLAPFILLCGGLLSLLAAGLTRAESKARMAAQESARVTSQSARDLGASEAKFRCLVERSLVGIYVICGDRFVYVNRTMAEMFRCSAAEMIEAPVLNFIFEPDRAKVADNIQKRLTGEVESVHYALRGLRQDGAVIHLEALGTRTEFAGQTAILGTLLDVTERKRAEAEVLKLNEELEHRVTQRTAQLEAANNELEAFSYSVSHDLRAPLRHVDGFAAMLARHVANTLDEKGRRYLKNITETAKEMGRLIDDLLDFSHMGRVEMRQTLVELEPLVAETISGLDGETAGRNIIWTRHPLPPIQCDRALLKQVFVNLLANAVKYSRPRDPARIEIGCLNDAGPELVLFVRDNGVGFDTKYAQKLFGVFQRLHLASDFEGTGIGLANVKRIVARHGGRVWAESELNVGATFWFSLPRK